MAVIKLGCSDVDKDHVAACLKHYVGYGFPRTGIILLPTFLFSIFTNEKYWIQSRSTSLAFSITMKIFANQLANEKNMIKKSVTRKLSLGSFALTSLHVLNTVKKKLKNIQ